MEALSVKPVDIFSLKNLKDWKEGLFPRSISGFGNLDILHNKALGFFCSVKCPGNLILQTYDLARALRDAHITVIGGFHSPMEKECLNLLLRGQQPVIICPARSIKGMRLPSEWQLPLSHGRLLLLSPFDDKQRRTTSDLAEKRNEFVAAIADVLFIAHAAPSSKTERFCREVLTWGKPLFTLDSEQNVNLISLGARPVIPNKAPHLMMVTEQH
jgi:predicted Rossmann fold nucleotide-binding protein DprA/Smf involved in DNA uptake